MKKKISWFTNVSEVSIGAKMPSEDFPLEVDGKGTPLDMYWRKRLKEGAITEQKAASPDAASEAPRKTAKKGKN